MKKGKRLSAPISASEGKADRPVSRSGGLTALPAANPKALTERPENLTVVEQAASPRGQARACGTRRRPYGFEESIGMLPQPCQLVIFGAPGDLSWRKLLPAVYNLNVDGVLPSHFAVVGFGLPAEGEVKGDPDEWMRNRARDGISSFLAPGPR